MLYKSTKQELDKEMDRLLAIERQCLKSIERTNNPKTQKELLDVLDSIHRQKKQLSVNYAL